MHLDIMIQIHVSHNFLFIFLVSKHYQIGFVIENGITKIKRSSCLMTVMPLRNIKSLKISSPVCCCLGKSSWSILLWNTISSKSLIELKTQVIMWTLWINFSRKSWNDGLHVSLMGTKQRMHQWFGLSPPSRRSTSSTYITVVGLSCRVLILKSTTTEIVFFP